MNNQLVRIITLIGITFGVQSLSAEEMFKALSPGSDEEFTAVEWRCPTFSWTQLENASYEIIVTELDLVSSDQDSSFRHALPAGSGSWTPSGDACFKRGRSYTWMIVATDEFGVQYPASELLFSVPEGPSPAEISSAIEILRAAGAIPETDGILNSESFGAQGAPLGSSAAIAVSGEVDSTVNGSAGVEGLATGSSGDTSGVSGSTNSPGGVGIRAINNNAGGGTDLLLDGSAQSETDAALTQSSLDRASGNAEVFNFTNSGAGLMNLQVDGANVVTTNTDQDTLAELGCGEGEIARFVLGGWDCQDINDGTIDPNAGTIHIPVWAFENDMGHQNTMLFQWNRSFQGFLRLTQAAGTPPFTGLFGAPVVLPDGVTVTEITAYYYDDAASHDMSMSMIFRRRGTTDTLDTTLGGPFLSSSSGASTTIQTVVDSTISNAVIDSDYFYYLTLRIDVDEDNVSGADLRFYGVTIKYTSL